MTRRVEKNRKATTKPLGVIGHKFILAESFYSSPKPAAFKSLFVPRCHMLLDILKSLRSTAHKPLTRSLGPRMLFAAWAPRRGCRTYLHSSKSP